MRHISRQGVGRRGAAWLFRFGVVSLCAVLSAGDAQGQEKTAPSGRKLEAKRVPAVKPTTTSAAKGQTPLKPKAPPNTAPPAKPGAKSAARKPPHAKRAVKFEMDPNAKWSCAQLTVSREPVWRKSGSLTFDFSIHNEGTADLKIKGKGG